MAKSQSLPTSMTPTTPSPSLMSLLQTNPTGVRKGIEALVRRYQNCPWYVKLWRRRWYIVAWWRGFRYWLWMRTYPAKGYAARGLSPWRIALGEVQAEKMAWYVTLEEIRKEMERDDYSRSD